MQDWGNNRPGDDLEKVIVDFTKKVKEKMQGKGDGGNGFKPGRGIAIVILVAIVGFGAMSSFYKV
ncbi:MAG: hypothetical protein GWN87_28450, partial [Desulfuromonadales bacterium]|nr:hypothetical protein [Desulfuromonadales bacterium]NIS43601.1 hypothetical protein [Desulfuromonadales bacterium]